MNQRDVRTHQPCERPPCARAHAQREEHLTDQQFYNEACVQLDTLWQLCGIAMDLDKSEARLRVVLIYVIGHYVQQVQEPPLTCRIGMP
jgi:hypothetical protein